MRSLTTSDQGFATLVVLEIETRLVNAASVADATHAAHAASASDVSLDAAHATDATDATGANDVNASHVNGCNWTKKDVHPIGSQRMGDGCR